LSTLADWSRVFSFLITAAQLLITVGIIYLGSKFVGRKDCDKKCKAHEGEVALLKDKLQAVKDAQANAPSGREMSAIKDQLADLSAEIKGMSATTTAQTRALDRVTHQLDLLLENELNGGK
jgi:regulatory protein YycI of two-component signal transduction system YycFG